MDQMTVGKEVGAVTQAVNILRAIADAEAPMGVTALARAANVSPSTTLNILRTLIGQKLVGFSAHNKTYRLDVGLLELARSLLNSSAMNLLMPELQDLARRFEATVTVWQMHGERHLLVGRVVPEEGVHIEFPVASRVSAYAGATGRMMLALGHYSEAQIRAAIEGLPWNEPVPFARYLKELKQARENGYAIDAGHLLRSVTSVAAAMVDVEGRPRLAISLHTFLGQHSPAALKELGEALTAMCRRNEVAMFGKRA
ncbi:IclR family transcriptional regulator [Ramlibacter sp.]|uniref:IclR family transcriptional regulator n=1 Tax=Ramlibacter sp. TaxID=1917967 RepID=UPI003D0F57C7